MRKTTKQTNIKPQIDNSEKVRIYLEQEFENRCRSNSNYSLRSFAKSLNVDSSYLSKVLSKKRTLNHKALITFAEKLGYPKDFDFLKSDVSPNPISTSKANTNSKSIGRQKKASQMKTALQLQFNALKLDEFKLISDWYHYAILEIINLDSFKPDTKWIATELNIPFGECYAAINRLKRLGLLKISENGDWESQPNTTTTNNFSTTAFKTLQKQILEQAISALDKTAMPERDQTSITMCIDRKRLPEAKAKIKKFRRELMLFLENGDSKDEVYQLSLSLFPITNITDKTRNTNLGGDL